LYGIQKGCLNGEANVLGVGELVDVTDADESSLAGKEGLSGLQRRKKISIQLKIQR
jgi:hypothetical protein